MIKKNKQEKANKWIRRKIKVSVTEGILKKSISFKENIREGNKTE